MEFMPKTNEATATDLKVIERLQQLGWKLRVLRVIINQQNWRIKWI